MWRAAPTPFLSPTNRGSSLDVIWGPSQSPRLVTAWLSHIMPLMRRFAGGDGGFGWSIFSTAFSSHKSRVADEMTPRDFWPRYFFQSQTGESAKPKKEENAGWKCKVPKDVNMSGPQKAPKLPNKFPKSFQSAENSSRLRWFSSEGPILPITSLVTWTFQWPSLLAVPLLAGPVKICRVHYHHLEYLISKLQTAPKHFATIRKPKSVEDQGNLLCFAMFCDFVWCCGQVFLICFWLATSFTLLLSSLWCCAYCTMSKEFASWLWCSSKG